MMCRIEGSREHPTTKCLQVYAADSPTTSGISSKRIRWAFFAFGLFGVGELVYIILWIILPRSS